jgi:hypothetical protein
MSIRVFDIQGDQLELAPPVKAALAALGLEADTSEANWEELTQKMGRVLETDGFEVMKFQPEISYYDTKKGKKILEIRFNYWGI